MKEETRKIEKRFILLDGINGDQYKFDTIDEAKSFIKKEFIDPEDGIHPDIESIQLVESVMTVSVKEIDVDDEYYEVVFNESAPSKVRELEDHNAILVKNVERAFVAGRSKQSWSQFNEELKNTSYEEELADKSLKLDVLYADWDHITELNRELVAALTPFQKLGNEVLNNSNLDKDQVVYAYNKATITMQDLRNVLSVLSKARNQK